MTGTDLSLIAEEMKKAQEILKKIQEMKSGVIAMGDKRIAVQTGASSTMSTVSINVSILRQLSGSGVALCKCVSLLMC